MLRTAPLLLSIGTAATSTASTYAWLSLNVGSFGEAAASAAAASRRQLTELNSDYPQRLVNFP